MPERIRVAVVGLADGPEADAGASVLACLDPARYERVAIVGERNEAGAARPGLCDRVLRLPPVGSAEFPAALAEAVRRERLEVVLPGSARAARVLAEGRAAAGAAGGTGLVAKARRKEVPPAKLAAALRKQERWPLLVLGEHGDRRRANDYWEAMRAHQALAADGGAVTLCELRPQQGFEVALVLDEQGEPLADAAVRVLADDERLRPWLAVTIENRALRKAALRFARAAGLAGPLQLLFQRRANAFELIDARGGFPLWIEVVLAGGPNLVELAVAAARGAAPPSKADFPGTPAGVLFSQTAEDHVLPPATANAHD